MSREDKIVMAAVEQGYKPQGSEWRIPNWFPELSAQVHENLVIYHKILVEFNKAINLVSPQTAPEADKIHFADSILACQVILADTSKKLVFDFGSGNGFPGLIMGILAPDRQVVLVESDLRKSEFLKHVIAQLGLGNVKVVRMRVEDLKPGAIEVAMSRGFSSISKALLNYRHLFPIGGRFYHLKGDHWASEVAAIPTQLCSIWTPELVGSYKLPSGGVALSVVVTEKIEEK